MSILKKKTRYNNNKNQKAKRRADINIFLVPAHPFNQCIINHAHLVTSYENQRQEKWNECKVWNYPYSHTHNTSTNYTVYVKKQKEEEKKSLDTERKISNTNQNIGNNPM